VHQTIEHPLWHGISSGSRFYFVHSYYPDPGNRQLIAGYSAYPGPFTCAVAESTLFAVQFHPEKSQAAGLRLLSNFVHWDGAYRPLGKDQSMPMIET
jgi:glutamine amidotransferase